MRKVLGHVIDCSSPIAQGKVGIVLALSKLSARHVGRNKVGSGRHGKAISSMGIRLEISFATLF